MKNRSSMMAVAISIIGFLAGACTSPEQDKKPPAPKEAPSPLTVEEILAPPPMPTAGKQDIQGEIFISQDGRTLLVEDKRYRNPFISLDSGLTFCEVIMGLWSGRDVNHSAKYQDPHHGGIWVEYVRENDSIVFKTEVNGKTQERLQKTNRKIEGMVVPLPAVRDPLKLFKTKSGQFLLASRDHYRGGLTSIKVFKGALGSEMIQVPLKGRPEYFLDGGTTRIFTQEQTLYWGSPLESPVPPTWGKEEIEQMDMDKYVVSETPDGIARVELRK